MTRMTPFHEFVQRANEFHNNKYSYFEPEYYGMNKKTGIYCPVHKEKFFQIPKGHLKHGCKKCSTDILGDRYRHSLDEVICIFRKVHGGRFDYSLVKYEGNHTPVKVICKEHGIFNITPAHHKNGVKCRKCSTEENKQLKVENFSGSWVEQAKGVHGDLYDYSKSKYKGSETVLKIGCPTHGIFKMRPANHIHGGQGCPKCGHERKANHFKYTFEQVVETFGSKHGDTYEYPEQEYVNNRQQIEIICNKHGSFFQRAGDHQQGKGCPACAGHQSIPETEIGDFLEQLGIKVIRRDRETIKPKELDILLPDLNLAIEYNGLIWHSEKFKADARRHMIDKQKTCAEKGIRLLHINSTEDPTVIKRTLAVITGYDEERIFARKCKVEKLTDGNQINDFLDKHHIQGAVPAKNNVYGLTYKSQLAAVMVFSKPASRRGAQLPGQYELRRYSALCRIPGGASRLLKAFLRDHPDTTEVFSFSDNRWFTGGMYKALGFTKKGVLKPDYQYVNGYTAYPKNHFTRARMVKRDGFSFDPDKSERENCWDNSFYRVWDCGKTSWILRK